MSAGSRFSASAGQLGALLTLLGVLLSGCGGAQNQDVGGEVYCASYENNYLGDCRVSCENEASTSDGDMDAIKECSNYCKQRLAQDTTYNDACKNK